MINAIYRYPKTFLGLSAWLTLGSVGAYVESDHIGKRVAILSFTFLGITGIFLSIYALSQDR